VVLLNTAAGSREPAVAERLADAFRSTGCEPVIRLADSSELPVAATQVLKEGHPVIVAAGGDGTVSTVAATLVGTHCTLGVMPLGTLNHFARDLHIPLDINDAARVIAAGRTTMVDVGDVNRRVFINNASIGLYPILVSERERLRRRIGSKWLALAIAAVRVWGRYRRLRVSVRGGGVDRIVRTPFVFVGNNRYELSGVELFGRSSLNEGELHLCMAPGMTRAGVIGMIVAAVFGRVGRVETFESVCAPEFEIDVRRPSARLGAGPSTALGTGPRLVMALDGELMSIDNPLTFGVRSAVLRVLVPPRLGSRPTS
jgi:diacylglycerol kinase family enzyme